MMPKYSAEQRAVARQRATEAEAKAIVKASADHMATTGKLRHERDLNQYREYLAPLDEFSEQQREILAHLMVHGMPYQACKDARVPPQTYFSWIKANPDYKEWVAECKKFAADRLERVAIALATGEYMRPLVSGGQLAAYEQVFDSRLLLALLKSRKPEDFRDRVDVTSNGHTLVKLVDKGAWDSV